MNVLCVKMDILLLDNTQENSSNTTYEDEVKKDGQGDRNVLSGSEKERECNSEDEEDEDGHMNLPPNPKIVYMKTTKDKEKGVRITTSVSVGDMKDSVPKITFQLSRELLSEHRSDSEIIKTKAFGLKLKLEMKERMEPNGSVVESDFYFTYGDDCKEPPPAAEPLERPSEHAWTSRDAHSSGQAQEDARLPASKTKDSPDVSQYFSEQGFGSGGPGPAPPTEEHQPRLRSTALDGLALSALHHSRFHPARPKRSSWIQKMGAEQRGCLFPMKRCHTFPGMSEAPGTVREELLLPYQGCVLSFIMNSLPFNAVRLGNIHQEKIRRSSFGSRRPQRPPSTWRSNSEVHQDLMICGLIPRGRQTISRYCHRDVTLDLEGRQGNFGEEAGGWFHPELEGEDPRPEQLPEKLRPTQMLCQPGKSGEHQDGASVLPQPVAAEHPCTFPPAASALPDEWSEDANHLLTDTENREGEQKQEAERGSSHSAAMSADKQEEKLTKTDGTSQQSSFRRKFHSCSARIRFKGPPDSRWKPSPVSADTSQCLRPVDGGGVSDHWAVKRKLFKENKQWSSAGGSSITSDMTDEQGWSEQPGHSQRLWCAS